MLNLTLQLDCELKLHVLSLILRPKVDMSALSLIERGFVWDCASKSFENPETGERRWAA